MKTTTRKIGGDNLAIPAGVEAVSVSSLRNLMRVEVRPPSIKTVHQAWRWFCEGLGVFLPPRIKEFGLCPKAAFIEIKEDGALKQAITYRSWFDETRLRSVSSPDPSLPAEIALPAKDYFVTRASLPIEATRTIDKTIALRLSDISPIPPEDAAFARGEMKRTKDGRIHVDVAVMRKQTLAGVKEKFANKNIAAIGAAPDENGALRFTFERVQLSPAGAAWARGAIALALSAAFFFIALNIHLSQRIANLNAYDDALRAELRNLRPAIALFENAEPALLKNNRGEPASVLFAKIQGKLTLLPDGARVQNASASPTTINIEGYLPAQASLADSFCPPVSRAASRRPGFDRFECSLSTESGDE